MDMVCGYGHTQRCGGLPLWKQKFAMIQFNHFDCQYSVRGLTVPCLNCDFELNIYHTKDNGHFLVICCQAINCCSDQYNIICQAWYLCSISNAPRIYFPSVIFLQNKRNIKLWGISSFRRYVYSRLQIQKVTLI